jgi:hypothetical protein
MRPAASSNRRGEIHSASQPSAPDIPMSILIGGRSDAAFVRAGQGRIASRRSNVVARDQRAHASHDLTFLLESVLFLLIGLQLPQIIRGLSVGRPLEYAGGGPDRTDCGEDGVDVQHPCVCPARSS